MFGPSSVLLLGNEEGVENFAKQMGCNYSSDIKINDEGIPYLDSAFNLAYELTTSPFLCYVNSDIIMPYEWLQCFATLSRSTVLQNREWLATSRRYDVDPGWVEQVCSAPLHIEELRSVGFLNSDLAIDIFLYTRHLFRFVPSFLVGRPWWDNWLLWKSRDSGADVIDCSLFCAVGHITHGWSFFSSGRQAAWASTSTRHNARLSEGKGLSLQKAASYHLTETACVERGPQISLNDICDLKALAAYKIKFVLRNNVSSLNALVDGIIDALRTMNIYLPIYRWQDFDLQQDTLIYLPSGTRLNLRPKDDLSDGVLLVVYEEFFVRALFSRFFSQMHGRQVVLWGYGTMGKSTEKRLRRYGMNINAAVDQSSVLLEGDVRLPIYLPDQIEHWHPKPFVLITSSFFWEIEGNLVSMQFKEEADYFIVR